jgi:hypothetical protein
MILQFTMYLDCAPDFGDTYIDADSIMSVVLGNCDSLDAPPIATLFLRTGATVTVRDPKRDVVERWARAVGGIIDEEDQDTSMLGT